MSEFKKPEVCMIVAHTEHGLIGANGSLPWKCSEDMKRFKYITAHYPVVFGTGTAAGLPQFPLLNRPGGILSKLLSDPKSISNKRILQTPNGEVRILSDFDEMLNWGKNYEKIFIAGGAGLYKSALQSEIIDTIYRTVFPDGFCKGDKYLDAETLSMMDEPTFRPKLSAKLILNKNKSCYFLNSHPQPGFRQNDTQFPWIEFQLLQCVKKSK